MENCLTVSELNAAKQASMLRLANPVMVVGRQSRQAGPAIGVGAHTLPM
jgi:hypothetical protein